MKIKCLIVDDEQVARQGLQLLCEEFQELQIVGLSKDGVEAIDDIQSFLPDLVLLDIQMPKINGFEVLQNISPPLPQIIFITAHDEFAIQAFEVNAIDYLLKPFSDERFEKAIKKAIAHIQARKKQNFSSLVQRVKSKPGIPQLRHSDKNRLIVKSDGRIQVISKEDIVQIEAFDYYVKIHIPSRFYLIRETMKNMEDLLVESNFMRVHKSHIVNKNYIKELFKEPGSDFQIITTNQQKVKISRLKINTVKDWIHSV